MDPNIEQFHSDLCTVGDYKLVLYTSYLAFGKPIFQRENLQFGSNVLLIKEHHFLQWFHFFENTLLRNKTRKPCHNTLIYTEEEDDIEALNSLKNCVVFSVSLENEHLKFEITSSFDRQFTFSLTEVEIYLFHTAFTTLFFKVYCYKAPVYYSLSECVKGMNLDLLKRNSFNEFLHQVPSFYSFISDNEMYLVSELLLRHRQIILKWKEHIVSLFQSDEEEVNETAAKKSKQSE